MSESDHSYSSMEDDSESQSSLLTSRRLDDYFNDVSNSEFKPPFKYLFIALIAFAFTFLFICTSIKPIESNLDSVMVSSFNVSTNNGEIKGSWDVTLNLNKNVKDFNYKAEAWVFSENEFISEEKMEGNESLVHGEFGVESIQEFISREYGLVLDLFIEAEATFVSKYGWWRTAFVMINCHDLKIEFPLDESKIGRLSVDAKSCLVHFSPSKMAAYWSR